MLASRLLAEGAEVRALGPVARRELLPGRRALRDAVEAVNGADAAVIVTEWPRAAEFPREEMRDPMGTR